MFIKTFNSLGEEVIVNINMAGSKLIRVEGTKLVFEMAEGEQKTHDLFSSEKAKDALNSIFVTLGASSPYDKTLDLTATSDLSIKPSGMTIPEIAKKLKVNPKTMSIVWLPSSEKYLEEEGDTEESVDNQNDEEKDEDTEKEVE